MAIPTNRTVNSTKQEHVNDHNAIAALSNNALPAATPFTTTTMPNPVSGVGTIDVVVFPSGASDVLMGVAIAGDAFPRWLIAADPNNGLYMGDGTFDPYNGNGVGFYASFSSTTSLNLIGGDEIFLGQETHTFTDIVVESPAAGVILTAPNNTKYRISVNNAGVLSTTVVP